MAGRKDKAQSARVSRVAVAIGIGILIGCVFAFLHPHGFFDSDLPIRNRRLGKSEFQVWYLLP